MRRVIVALGVGVLLLGGSAAGAADKPDFQTTARTVAIVSLLGDTVQAPGGVPIPAPDAAFDPLAERVMAGQIKADLPDAQVVLVGGPREPLLERMYPRTGFGDVGMAQTREALRPWAATHAADYIVILRKTVGVLEYRDVAYSMNAHWTEFGIGLSSSSTPIAFLNVTVCDARTMDVVAQMSVRDLGWGSIRYGRHDPTPAHLPVLVSDVKAMLASVVPGLVHGAGI
jgi:hypothetical protein